MRRFVLLSMDRRAALLFVFVILVSAGCLGTADEMPPQEEKTPPYGENTTISDVTEGHDEDEVQGYSYTLRTRDTETGELRRELTTTIDYADERMLIDVNVVDEEVSRTTYVDLSSGIRYVDRELGDAIYPEPQPEEMDADEAVERYSLSGTVGSFPANETRLSVEETGEEGVFRYSTDSVMEDTEVTNVSVTVTAEGFIQGFSLTAEGTEYTAEIKKMGDIEVEVPDWADTEEVSRTFDVDGVAGGPSVYVGFSGVGVSDEGGAVYALDARTGEPKWGFTKPESGIYSSPTVVDGIVYVGSNDGRLYALDATDGDELWRFKAEGGVYASPTVVNETVYFGTEGNGRHSSGSGGALHAVDAETGEREWVHKLTIRVSAVRGAPAVADGTVYFGALDGSLHAVNAGTGGKVWDTEIGEDVTSSVTVVDGSVYATSKDNTLHSVDRNTGEEIWNFTGPADFDFTYASPTVAESTVYAGSPLYAVNTTTGKKEWMSSEIVPAESSPIVAGNTVYLGSIEDGNGVLHAVDDDTEVEKWRFTEPDGWADTTPTVLGNTVYFGTRGGSVYAVDTESGEKKWEFDEPRGEVRSSPTVVKDPSDGSSVGSRVLYGTLGHHDEVRAGERLTTEDMKIEDTD